jgi:hypothetical protein
MTESGKQFSVVEDLGKVFATLGGVFFLFSVFYDYCYLNALGLTFREVPTNITDHVRSAIVWAPRLLIFLLFSFSIIFLLTISDRLLNARRALYASDSKKRPRCPTFETPNEKQALPKEP